MSEQGLNAEEVRYQTLLELDVAAEGALEALVAGLHDESWRVRRVAAEGFARLPDGEAVVARLIAVLGERDETGARNAAAEALAGLGEVALGPLVRLLLEHEDPDQRKFSADILGHLDRPEAEEALVQALQEDADLNVRVAAAEALGKVGAQAGARALERVLHVSEPLLQLSALESLAALRCPPPLPEVVRLLGEAPLRRSAYRVLGLIPQVAATELLCRGLGSESRSVREAALVALGLQAGLVEPSLRPEMDAAVRQTLERLPDAAEWLEGALAAGDLELRAGALVAAGALREPRLAALVAEVAQEDRLLSEVVRALSRFGPEAGRVLLASLEWLSLPAREAAGQALVEMVDASYVLELVEMLDWGEDDLKRVAVQALGRTRSLEAVAPLAGLLDSPELAVGAVRALLTLSDGFPQEVSRALEEALARGAEPAVLGALVRVGGTAMLPLVRRTARDASPPLRATAVEVLAAVDPVGGRELARTALADEAPRVRAAAVRVLGQLGDASAGPLLIRALHDEAQEVLLAAVDALGEYGVAEHARELEGLVHHPEGAVAFRAVHALARLGALRDEVLRRAVAHADPEVVKAALQAGVASSAGVSLSVGLLGHERWDVRAAAARVLGDSGGSECLPAARAALVAETDELARRALVEAVDRLSRR